jgi:MoaA/NifB/PqqE/SkfB family radical SAM enzyme
MSLNPYDDNKVLLHVDRLQQLKHGEQPAPVHVQLILSDLCNLNCNFCAYRSAGYFTSELFPDENGNYNPHRFMSTDKAFEILQDCAIMGVKAIQFTGGGEPTVHINFPVVLRKAHRLGLETGVVTNGVRMNDELRDELLASTWVRVSLDAGTPGTYAAIKGLNSEAAFHKVIENTATLARLCRNRRESCYLGLSFVVTRDNWREIPEATKIACSLGVHSIRFSAVFTNENAEYFAGLTDQINDLIEQGKRFERQDFRVINNFRDRFSDLSEGRPDFQHCRYMHLTTYIGADLNVYACCVTAYNRYGLIGSIANKRFAEFWHSPEKRDFFERFDARQCPRCQFLGRNRQIQRTMDQIPEGHWNFI